MKTAKRATENNSRIGFTASTSAQFKGGIVCKLYNKKGDLTRVSDCLKRVAMRTQREAATWMKGRCEAGASVFFLSSFYRQKDLSDTLSPRFCEEWKVKNLRTYLYNAWFGSQRRCRPQKTGRGRRARRAQSDRGSGMMAIGTDRKRFGAQRQDYSHRPMR
jgi:hypothetical protein